MRVPDCKSWEPERGSQFSCCQAPIFKALLAVRLEQKYEPTILEHTGRSGVELTRILAITRLSLGHRQQFAGNKPKPTKDRALYGMSKGTAVKSEAQAGFGRRVSPDWAGSFFLHDSPRPKEKNTGLWRRSVFGVSRAPSATLDGRVLLSCPGHQGPGAHATRSEASHLGSALTICARGITFDEERKQNAYFLDTFCRKTFVLQWWAGITS